MRKRISIYIIISSIGLLFLFYLASLSPVFALKLKQMAKKDTAPKIKLHSPKKDQKLTSAEVKIVGEVIDDKQVISVSINGDALTIKLGKKVKFQHKITLVEGKNTILIEAQDNGGHVAKLSRIINYSATSHQVSTLSESTSEVTRIGEPLKIAVLTFGSQSQSEELEKMGVILAEMLTTSLGKTKRFNLIERAQLQSLLKEQGLSQSGFIDEATAKKIGKIVAVDAIVSGTFSELTGCLRVDLRLIDTETGKILITEGIQSRGKSTDDLILVAEELAKKIRSGFPILEGKIIKIKEGGEYLINLGKEAGLTPGTRLVAYREGEEIIIDGKSYGKEIKILGEIQAENVFDKYTSANIIKFEEKVELMVGDKVVTK